MVWETGCRQTGGVSVDDTDNYRTAEMAVTPVQDFHFSYSKTDILSTNTLHHYHDACEIDFFLQADLQIFLKDTRYTIRDGDVFYMDEYDIHHILYQPVSQSPSR